MSELSLEKIDTKALDENILDITQQVFAEPDTKKSKDLIELFNWNMSKKNVARVLRLNDLFDGVTEQMMKRFSEKPDLFSMSMAS